MDTTDSQKQWIYCPICHGKTRIMVKEDTVLYNFPLFCPHCKNEADICVVKYFVQVMSGLSKRARIRA